MIFSFLVKPEMCITDQPPFRDDILLGTEASFQRPGFELTSGWMPTCWRDLGGRRLHVPPGTDLQHLQPAPQCRDQFVPLQLYECAPSCVIWYDGCRESRVLDWRHWFPPGWRTPEPDFRKCRVGFEVYPRGWIDSGFNDRRGRPLFVPPASYGDFLRPESSLDNGAIEPFYVYRFDEGDYFWCDGTAYRHVEPV